MLYLKSALVGIFVGGITVIASTVVVFIAVVVSVSRDRSSNEAVGVDLYSITTQLPLCWIVAAAASAGFVIGFYWTFHKGLH